MDDKDVFKICDIVFQMNDEGAACGIQFSDEFMNQDEALQEAMVAAMHTTINNFVEHSGMVMKDDDIDEATQDAANFLDRCINEQKGKPT